MYAWLSSIGVHAILARVKAVFDLANQTASAAKNCSLTVILVGCLARAAVVVAVAVAAVIIIIIVLDLHHHHLLASNCCWPTGRLGWAGLGLADGLSCWPLFLAGYASLNPSTLPRASPWGTHILFGVAPGASAPAIARAGASARARAVDCASCPAASCQLPVASLLLAHNTDATSFLAN